MKRTILSITQLRQSDVYTTREAGLIIGCSFQTVIRYIDAGELVGYKLPCSRHRRARHPDLLAFALRHGLTHAIDWLKAVPEAALEVSATAAEGPA
jgi:hypothetical protein